MTDDLPKIEEALEELASMGRRITQLTNAFRAHSDASDEEAPPSQEGNHASECDAGDCADQLLSELTTKVTTPARPPVLLRPAAAGKPTPQKSLSDGVPMPARRRRPVGPLLVSTGLHVVALLGLAMVIFAQERPPEPVSILSTPFREEPLDELFEVDITAFETAALPESEQADPAGPELPDVAALDPTPLAVDQMASMEDPLPIDGGDLLGGSIDVGDLLASVNTDAGGGGKGKSAGKGDGRGDGRPAAATFFGRQGAGRTALFICDNSASYAEGGFQSVLLELSRAIGLMKPDQSFHVIFFSDAAYPLFHPEKIDTFLPATPDNKRRLDAWLGTVELCVGGQGIRDAADLAVSLKPDVVYFLSDGDHGESTIERMAALPLEGTVVHTFGMQSDIRNRRTGLPDPAKIVEQQQRNHSLVRIAEAHGGSFTPVTISPQAAVAASVRPLRKNRTRGAIWGINLPAVAP
jgi:hypothetical protein